MKKRLIVFVFYNPQGLVGEYVLHLLKANREIASRQVFLANHESYVDIREVEKIVDQIILRPNKGFDGGAYQDYFLNHTSKKELSEYDEIILMNDSFYGPFYSWKDVMALMDSQGFDAWGLTKHPGGGWLRNEAIPEHIQGYFWVLEKKAFMSGAFIDFWSTLPEICDYYDAILNYEISFSCNLKKKGFNIGCFIDIVSNGEYIYKNEVQYLTDLFNLVSKYRLPVIKRKAAMSLMVWDQVKTSIEFIEKEYDYPTDFIKLDLDRNDKTGSFRPFGYSDVIEFARTHSRVFLYGAGRWGHGIEFFLESNGIKPAGFIVTNKDGDDSLYDWNTAELCKGDGIIISAGMKIWEEMFNEARRHVEDADILWPRF